jgi:hypothetical protein
MRLSPKVTIAVGIFFLIVMVLAYYAVGRTVVYLLFNF